MSTDMALAVVGMAVRLPGARNLADFWRNLAGGVESITPLPAPAIACGLLDDADCFDAELFGYAPRDAFIIDPQHRVFLECAWEALEDAGYDPGRYPGPIGVYAGCSQTGYASLLHSRRDSPLLSGFSDFALRLGCGMDFLTTRVAYKLGLTGPAVTVQTACSTSLVAIHFAGQALLAGECDLALAGGVTVHVPAYAGEYSPDGILSADGHCRAFDAAAGGTVGGDGAGIVVLKRLESALADRDTIHAVMLASAVNNDGSDKLGFTAPSVTGQASAIVTALRLAGAPASSVSYVEAHGTGTYLGDPIEVAALASAFESAGGLPQRCWIGSVKTNIGHTDAAAGVAGFVKTVLALKHRQIPPSLHFTTPHPGIAFGPFTVPTDLVNWPAPDGQPRRAGVTSLGIGGTNAHVVLEEAPPAGRSDVATQGYRPSQRMHLVPVSGRTRQTLGAVRSRLADALEDESLVDVAWTSQVGRRHHAHRAFVVAADVPFLAAGLAAPDTPAAVVPAGPRRIAFLFPGQGGQRAGMTRSLYAQEPVFAAEIDACARLFESPLKTDLREVMFGSDEDRMTPMTMAQACVFAVEYALARLWQSWGVHPDAVLGHSLGAYAAACIAGVFDLADAVTLVAARGRLLQDLPAGAMVAVPLPADQVAGRLPRELDIATVNAVDQCVVSGPRDAIGELLAQMRATGVDARELRISAAAHSALVEPVVGSFRAAVSGLSPRVPSIPMVSDHSGAWLAPDEATDPGYWAAHLRSTIRFADALATLLAEDAAQTLIEVGPGTTLSALARRHPAYGPGHVVHSSLPHVTDDTPEHAHFLSTAGRVWLAGHDLDWAALHQGEEPRRIPLPTYPFQRTRYQIDPDPAVPVAIVAVKAADEDDDDYVAPRTEWEESVAAAFANILGVTRAGALDSFLDLGGDSLIAAQLTSWIRTTYGIPATVRALLRAPTVAGIAGLIETALGRESAGTDATDIRPADARRPAAPEENLS